MRRTQDAGADCAHFENRETIAQLIFREINADSRDSQNFPARAVLLTNGETYLRRIVSKSENFTYFDEPGWRIQDASTNDAAMNGATMNGATTYEPVELFLRFPRNRMFTLRVAHAGGPEPSDQRSKPAISSFEFD